MGFKASTARFADVERNLAERLVVLAARGSLLTPAAPALQEPLVVSAPRAGWTAEVLQKTQRHPTQRHSVLKLPHRFESLGVVSVFAVSVHGHSALAVWTHVVFAVYLLYFLRAPLVIVNEAL